MTVTRFAPSPTGFLHIGGARTALFSWLFARSRGGKFLLRIEDTDRERSTNEAVQAIFEGMDWLGLCSDVEPVYQTRRMTRYAEAVEQLLEQGLAYPCYATREELDALRQAQQAAKQNPRYDGRWRPEPGKDLPEIPPDQQPVIRFRNPQQGQVVVRDVIKGDIVFDNASLDDLIIARADGTPTYNFCVVVDDMDMGITHVVRGDDHVNNTPRQLNILQALGGQPPHYAHVSMIHGADGSKLSKRHGALSVMEYRNMGFMPEALLNYLVRLGWSHGDQELFSRQEMIDKFDFEHVSPSAARFDMDKAYWVNHQYLKTSDPALIAPEFDWHLRRVGLDPACGPALVEVIEQFRERSKTLVEMVEKSRFVFEAISGYVEKDAKKHLGAKAVAVLGALIESLSTLDDWQPEPLHAAVHAVAEKLEVKLGAVAQPIRVAVAGQAVSPPIDQTLYLLGKTRSLDRLSAALDFASQAPAA